MKPIDILCAHCAKTLPDSIAERKHLLRAMEKVLRADSPVYRNVQSQLATINAMEKFDAQLKLHFKLDGHGDHH